MWYFKPQKSKCRLTNNIISSTIQQTILEQVFMSKPFSNLELLNTKRWQPETKFFEGEEFY